MKKLIPVSFAFLVSLMLSGCFSDMLKPAENHDAFYMLPTYNKANKQKFAEVNMQVLSVPDYLKRPQIVVKTQEATSTGKALPTFTLTTKCISWRRAPANSLSRRMSTP